MRGIIDAVDLPVQLGGGIRTLEQIEHWLSEGVSRVILGTAAVRDPDLVRRACDLFPDQIAVGIDAKDGYVAVEGWVEKSDIKVIELARMFEDAGVAAIIYTDIDRDGTGEGVNMEATIQLAQATRIPIIASGGVGALADIQAVKDASTHGINGVIVGKALYDGRVEPADVLKAAAG